MKFGKGSSNRPKLEDAQSPATAKNEFAARAAARAHNLAVAKQSANFDRETTVLPSGRILMGTKDRLKVRQKGVIDGILPDQGVVVLYGESQSYKTAVAQNMMMHVAYGLDWHGRKVLPGRVMYCAAEAPLSASTRMMSLQREYGKDPFDPRIEIMDGKFNLLGKDEVDERGNRVSRREGLCEDLRFWARQSKTRVRLVVLDTYSQAAPGGREDNAEFATIISEFEIIAKELKCVFMIIHHTGKDVGRGGRGGGSQYSNATGVLLVHRRGDEQDSQGRKLTRVRVLKLKEGEEPKVDFLMAGEAVDSGKIDDEGDPVKAWISKPTVTAPMCQIVNNLFGNEQKKLSAKQQDLLDTIEGLIADHGQTAPGGHPARSTPSAKIIEQDELAKLLVQMTGKVKKGTGAPARDANRAISTLARNGWLGIWHGQDAVATVWLVRELE
jgi:hypothetical protein